MGLISKTVMVKWSGRNKKHYIEKRYVYTQMKDEFEVRVEDLSEGSAVEVDLKCDCCGKILKDVKWYDYKKCVHEEGKCYCQVCGTEIFARSKMIKTKLENSKSFKGWCIDNAKLHILKLWDYELNKVIPSKVLYGSLKKYYFKCHKGIHDSELKSLGHITNNEIFFCKQCNSFAQWCIDNGEQSILSLWDYDLNKKSPFDIDKSSRVKYYFKCARGLHDSKLKDIQYFSCEKGRLTCNKCNSFEQWCVDNNKLEWLSLWDYEKNNCKPIEISRSPKDKYWFKCPCGKHESELKDIHSCTKNNSQERGLNCNKCNSFAQWGIDKLGEDFLEKYWDYKKNDELDINAWEISRCASTKIWIKCQIDTEHESYLAQCNNFYNGTRCPICNESKGEIRISEWFKNNDFMKNKDYIPQKEFDGLIGLKNGELSYDFYLPDYNLLIEYQGEFHDGSVLYQTEKDFEKQVEHDRRKQQYADDNKIELLPIWYWEFDNIEKILDKVIFNK